MDKEEFHKAYVKLVAKAWSDEEFKARLLSDPRGVFKENGIDVPEDLELKMWENTEKVVHFILPPKPSEEELSEEDLEKLAGGQYWQPLPPYNTLWPL